METKKCIKCGSILPVSEFTEDKRSNDGYRRVCKACAGVHENRLAKHAETVVNRSAQGGISALKGVSPQELISELRFRGYKGKLVYSKEVIV